jgi:hypothetical protein
MPLPRLQAAKPDSEQAATQGTQSTVLVVYAPFGSDATLSTYPDGDSQELAQHPLVRNLLLVAKQGVAVSALIDRVDEDAYLIEIPPNKPAAMRITSCWKLQMGDARTLAGLLRRTHANNPGAAIVLALEGHGAGFMPEIDRSKLTLRHITRQGTMGWWIPREQTPDKPSIAPILADGSPMLPDGSPMLPDGSPMLPDGSPMLPNNHALLSTWGLGEALRSAQVAGVPKVAVLHLNNCFNMAAEVLHTVAPYAEYATGYINYNFFTAGDTYPGVFAQLKKAGKATPEQLATWFALGNYQKLKAKGNHPTAGGVVQLSRMQEISEKLDDMADALLSALRAASGSQRSAVVGQIRNAIARAQQLDTPSGGGFKLDVPDELTDLRSLAQALQATDFGPHPVAKTARALNQALGGILAYSESGQPWVDTSVTWNFVQPMAMNILLPDPMLSGVWDWRSPFYMNVNPKPTEALVQPHVIEFLKVTDWVDFLQEYHLKADGNLHFIGLHPAVVPNFPVFKANFVPPVAGHGRIPDGKPDQQAPGHSSS